MSSVLLNMTSVSTVVAVNMEIPFLGVSMVSTGLLIVS